MADLPRPTGLYRPDFEHDACGVAFVVDMHGRRSHRMVRMGIDSLCHMEHRGASGAEVNTGDGAGILIQVPDAFYRAVLPFELPPAGDYATGIAFLPSDPSDARAARDAIDKVVLAEGLDVLGWREVPTDDSTIGSIARSSMPSFHQVFVGPGAGPDGSPGAGGMDLERRAFMLRKRARREVEGIYFASLSTRTIVYKGMLTAPQMGEFWPDLDDERLESALALVHSRFSTNTFPSWPLAHPYRLVAHNGEINTLKGNRNWMRARETLLRSDVLPGDLERIFPIVSPDASDSATFDEVLELLHMGGRSLPHAVLMMIPEAWENHKQMDPARRAFYQYHAALMEPWDGPASIAFTDGTVIGAVLDRNGLRPSRYWVTDDGLVVMASEVGVLEVDPARVVQRGRLQPGRMFLVDTAQGRIVSDDEIKSQLAAEHPYAEWVASQQVRFDDLPPRFTLTPQHASVVTHQRLFGWTVEDLKVLLAPMARFGAEPIGSMGTDTPLAVLSDRSRLLYDYFQQLFAQVTNPPLDAIREELVTSLSGTIGPEGNLLDPRPESANQIVLDQPLLTNEELAKLLYINEDGDQPGWSAFAIDGLFPVRGTRPPGEELAAALDEICARISRAVADGAKLIVLSDRHTSKDLAPIPALLLTAAVHHHLIKEKTRTKVGLVLETGEAREVHHMALLLGFGAAAINPYLALESIQDLINDRVITGLTLRQASRNYLKACAKGVLKIMSKMGISTVASYTGAQVFEAIGLAPDVVDRYFTGTVSRIGGVGLEGIAEEVLMRHRVAWPDRPSELAHRELPVGGEYQWRREGEYHLFNPSTVHKLQHSTRTKRFEIFKEYTSEVDSQAAHLATLRGLLRVRSAHELGRQPIPVEEVEPASAIMARFNTGAMSYGSISAEAHETLAIAMNRIGGRSNTGEGGEDPDRFTPDPNGDLRRSAVKQVASGRFGVTSEYLVNADDIQIKMAQGAKPGEGGQLPGHKVYPWIAKTRYSTPGVGLISPPPHHDIYSIEDLAQLIYDLKNANDRARVHVKLVAQVGVGTVAAGVSKAHADVVLISGHDGGTGASPLNSLKHAGAPWELGLAETQQTLMLNKLRDRIVVQVDGQLKTGRDVLIAALLGAEEYGFATAPLVVSGCIMMRVCHLDTCPVGIATQNPELRKRFSGTPEFVVTFFEYIAEEVRELMASLGFRSLDEIIGHPELLDTEAAVDHWKAAGLDLAPILEPADAAPDAPRRCVRPQDHGLEKALDRTLIAASRDALEDGRKVHIDTPVRNVNRSIGTLLGAEVSRRFGGAGLPDDTITIDMVGSAGQSLGAFLPKGVTLRLHGDANDYVGKGLSGGRIIVRPSLDAPDGFIAEDNIIAGNVILYGATAGEVFLRGVVGERFCVRNSGALAVVEGVGDHACEYMTGGRVVVLGPTGRNFGAGMSGGIAYVYDPEAGFAPMVNTEMVDLVAPGSEDLEFLLDAVERHHTETGSAVAEHLLGTWARAKESFVKVMPRDYQRVLDAAAKAEAEGRDVDAAIMAAAHG
ncbi:glutamate synthase large subunit [Acidiferrimicrobium sp. IK]|uniref:glutamate synthase large subunit n=1 Tax=Acidiferrimicrobium sp. IK TaxID=2871700 RepID=UPI0021CB6ACA|nr:glutamate synthase large subunit [Acidiferrimicrobium sp. IK]MCU4184580.1 glutamate synthase large subunit [Acidiferrimicrobium sp. IK]